MEPRVYRALEEVPADFGPCALTVGNFDGVHAGHRAILGRVVSAAREHGWKPSALTFHPHPAAVVSPASAPPLLTTVAERCRLLGEEGIEQVLVIPFTIEFSRLSPDEFAERVLVGALGARAVMVGSNFRFGRGQGGDTAKLAEFGRSHGYSTEVLEGVKLRGRMVSSSEIRRLVAAGDVSLANRMMGRPFAVEGAVVSGHGIGSRQTVPTLNLEPPPGVVPASGVYVTRTVDLAAGRRWPSVTNVGTRPTFRGDSLTVETHLLADLSGPAPAAIRVEFLRRLRPEHKFPDPASLKAQILTDASRARAFLRRWNRWVEKVAS